MTEIEVIICKLKTQSLVLTIAYSLVVWNQQVLLAAITSNANVVIMENLP